MRFDPYLTISATALCLLFMGLSGPSLWAQPAAPALPAPPVVSAQPSTITPPVSPTAPGTFSLSFQGLGTADDPQRVSTGLQLLALLTILSLAPAILTMVTSFVRIVVVLGFVRHALGTQQLPPTQVLVGLALFLTFFVMAPTFEQVNREAIQPYLQKQISVKEAYSTGMAPVREFLFSHCRKTDLALFIRLAKMPRPQGKEDIPSHVLIPAFLISELKTAFIIGFIIYVPFLIIDMVVSSILLSMGMMMLPPVIISLPFKVLLFVLVDGWNLVVGSLVRSF